MHSKAKWRFLDCTILNIYKVTRVFVALGSVFHEELLLQMVVTKHELLKITDKLIFSSLIISNRFTFLIIKYTFSSKLFSSTAYINMQTQVGGKHSTTEAQSNRTDRNEADTRATRCSSQREPQGFICAERMAVVSRTLPLMGKASSHQGQGAPLLYPFLPSAPPATTLGCHPRPVFPSSDLLPENTRPPSVSGQHKRMEGAATLALLQSHGPCSRDLRPHSRQPQRPLVGRHLSSQRGLT